MRLTVVSHMPHAVTIGGAQAALREALEQLAARGHDITVFCATSPRLISARPVPAGRGVVVVEHPELDDVLAAGRAHVLAAPPDVAIVPAEDPMQRPLRAVEGLGVATVVLAQSPAPLPFGPGSARCDARVHRLLGSATAILASSRFLAAYIREHGAINARPVVLPAGVPFDTGQRIAAGRDRVLMVNPSIIKGRTLLTAVAEKLSRHRFAAVVGWATDKRDLSALRAHDNIEVLPALSNICSYLATARALMVPSLWLENVPLVIGEALRAGVPVVASDIGGVPEALGGLGILLPVVPVRWRHNHSGEVTPVAPPQPVARWSSTLRELFEMRNDEWERLSSRVAAEACRRVADQDVAALEAELEQAGRGG
jgi:glycosyltransferase involved in cell wall biosynthesis